MKIMTTLYMEEELKRRSEQHADKTGRTLSGLIRYLLTQELKKNE